MSRTTSGARVLAVPLAIILTAGAPAQARIACKNGFQNVAGSYIATPYCQDALLAQVAREHGMSVSSHRIRENPNYKREVCRVVGNDIRVYEHCANERPGFHGGRRH